MPTLGQMRTAIDNFLTARWPTLVNRQETYASNHDGRYWQGLVTHAVLPAHTTASDGSVVPDRFDRKPSNQQTTWANVFPEWVLDLFPGAIWADVYDGPLGIGWTLTVSGTHNGIRWQRTQNVGPETWRTEGWHQVIILEGQ